jgi:hypothetical protein
MKKLRLPKSNPGQARFGQPVTSSGELSALTMIR